MENMVNVKSFVKCDLVGTLDESLKLIDYMIQLRDLNIIDIIDYNSSQDMFDVDPEFLEERQDDPEFMNKVQEAIDAGYVYPDTHEERLRQGYFLQRKEIYSKFIADYNLVVMAVLWALSDKYPYITQEHIDYVDGWVNEQDWETKLEDMIRYCDEDILDKEE